MDSPIPPSLAPLASVLMPCFNHQRHVGAALASIAASTYARLELVFIDDASQDNSFAVAEDWLAANRGRFERVVFERHAANRGITATLNELVSKASGDYIAFLASDDMLTPSGIAKQIEAARARDAAYVFADATLIDENGDLIAASALHFHGRDPQAMRRRSCLIVDVLLNWEMPWTRIFIRADMLRRLGPFDEHLAFEDRDFVVRALIDGAFTFIPDSVYVYRMRVGNRLTPGLDAATMLTDFEWCETKNFRAASGLTRLVLGLNVLAGRMRFDAHGVGRRSRTRRTFIRIRRFVVRLHLAAMRR